MEVSINNRSAEELIQLAQQGDQKAYGLFLEILQKQIIMDARRGLSRQEDQEELTQMVLLKVHQYLGSYSGNGSVLGWVRTITRNTLYDVYKGKDKQSFIALLDESENEQQISFDSENTPESIASLKQSLKDMPTEELAPIIENKVNNQNLQDLAKRDGTTVNNYKVKVHRAKKAFIKYLSAFVLLIIGTKL